MEFCENQIAPANNIVGYFFIFLRDAVWKMMMSKKLMNVLVHEIPQKARGDFMQGTKKHTYLDG